MTLAASFGWALVIAAGLFAAVFVFARRINNFGVVDVAWAGGFTPVAIFYASMGAAPGWRKLAVVGFVACWSLRLAWHLGQRVARLHPEEDGRYQQLRHDWAPGLDRKMALFFQAQAAMLVALSWPFLALTADSAPMVHPLEMVGATLVVLSVVGEALADAQLAAFKRSGAPRERVCDAGLWRYSRHPNYFFEWLVWVGFALAALPAPGGWAALACPAVMLYLLLRVTGIRYTEQQLERSKGAAYRAYRDRTSSFVPWFPRRVPAADRGVARHQSP